MDLRTDYLGLRLENPLIAGASPLTLDRDACRQLEDHGAAALVMGSLFAEQIDDKQRPFGGTNRYLPSSFPFDPQSYLEQIRKLKEALAIPVIASLNGVSLGGWMHHAQLIEQAGADAIELNVYYVAFDPDESSRDVEARYLAVLGAVKRAVRIPVAMKLSPFFSAPLYIARQLDRAGADALVLFNRFYQPDIDIESRTVMPVVHLSDPSELALRLRWLAALDGLVRASLGATGGVHDGRDVVKALMAGASGVQLTSALLRHGPKHMATVRRQLMTWMTENEYASARELIGSMSLLRCPEPAAFERANYMRVLQSWDLGTRTGGPHERAPLRIR